MRLDTPTFGLTSKGGETRPVLISQDSVVEIISGIENDQRMVEVDFDGTHPMMFVQDIEARGRLLEHSRRDGSEV